MTPGRARLRAALGSSRAGLAELADLVLARTCAGCDADATSWCASCASELVGPVCSRDVAGLPVWSGAAYEGVVREAVNAWKDHGRADLTPVFAERLAAVLVAALQAAVPLPAGHPPSGPVLAAGHAPSVLVPVPSARASRRARGREPVRELARATASRVSGGGGGGGGRVVVLPALAQQRRVAEQAGLGVADRARNLDGALAVPRGWQRHVAGRQVVVVDDVVTSGATLREAARALTVAGAHVVGAVSLAATARRQPAGSAAREDARRID